MSDGLVTSILFELTFGFGDAIRQEHVQVVRVRVPGLLQKEGAVMLLDTGFVKKRQL